MNRCNKCKKEIHEPQFMVHDSLWKSAGFDPKEITCLSCFEIGIGRKLNAARDLPHNIPLNWCYLPKHLHELPDKFKLMYPNVPPQSVTIAFCSATIDTTTNI